MIKYNNYIDIYIKNFKELKKQKIPPLAEKNIKSGFYRYQKIFNEDKLYLSQENNIEYMMPKEFIYARIIIAKLNTNDISPEYLNNILNTIYNDLDKIKLLNALYIDTCLYLQTILLQKEECSYIYPKIMNFIDLVEDNIIKEEMYEYQKSYNMNKKIKIKEK